MMDDTNWSTPFTHDDFQLNLKKYPIGMWLSIMLLHTGCLLVKSALLGLRGVSGTNRPRSPATLRSGRQFLCALVPLVPAPGAHLGGRHHRSAQALPGARWPHPLWEGDAPC